MKLAAIMPEEAFDLDESDYNFCFAEIALRNPRYAAYYRNAAKRGIVIMDTMVFEHQRPLSTPDWLDAIDIVRPTVTIAMDVMQNAEETKQRYRLLRQLTSTPLMAVAQGATFEALADCFEYFLERTFWIALPVQVVERRQERFKYLDFLRAVGVPSTTNIHLLGASRDDLLWERSYSDLRFVRGVDTTKPVAAALNGIRLPSDIDEATTRPQAYFTTPRQRCIDVQEKITANISYLRWIL